MTRVLVTGMSGLIGGALRRRLEGRYALSALCRRAVPGIPTRQADIADLEAIQPAFVDIDVVVHLAAVVDSDAPWEAVLRDNIVGAYNVFEAARRASVRRVVYASSGATISGHERDLPYAALVAGRYGEVSGWSGLTHEAPVRPAGLYGCSKVWGEALGRLYADTHGLSVICVRIGAVTPEDRPTASRHYSVWCSQRDIAQMLERCIAAPGEVRFEILYAVSDNRWGYRDLDRARRVVGFEPSDRAEDYRSPA